MKKASVLSGFICLFLIAALSACSTTAKRKAPEENVDRSGRAPSRIDVAAEAEILLNAFEKAVLRHDTDKVLEFLDPHYREKEFEDLYQSHKGAFLNDFFCGPVTRGDQNFCLVFGEIQEIQRMGIESFPDESRAHYIVKSNAHEISTHITVTVRKTYSFGVMGSKGYTQVE